MIPTFLTRAQKLSVWYDESSAYIQMILELYSTEITIPILKRIK